MKTFIFTVYLSLMLSTSFAQTDVATKSFLRQVIDKKEVIYADCVSGYVFDALEKTIDHYNNLSASDKKTITLTKSEYKYVKKELKKMKSYKWAADVFDKNKLISRDTLDTVFNGTGKGWPYFNNNFGKDFYSFTKPIFLRNNTICIVYLSHSCGELCGNGGAYIYVKENGRWRLEITLMSWVS